MNKKNNLVFQGIHLNQDDNQMNNYHLISDVEINYNHIQNVINVDKVRVEILKILHLYLLPKFFTKIKILFKISSKTCKP